MLFNSFPFIAVFLPVTLTGFFLLGHLRTLNLALLWLVVCSLFFYGWWNPIFLWVIIASVLCNYACGQALQALQVHRKTLLVLGIFANLLLLGYFKYADFFLSSVGFHIAAITLPLGISFFTFQQIAYLADTYKRTVDDASFLHYVLFVTFFPQLIAGPIVHHKDVLPQFMREEWFKPQSKFFVIGVTIFIIGLFKKVVLADSVAPFATAVFSAVDNGAVPTFRDSWIAALGYTMQLYFDFSGYSDMAIGAAQLFGITLPVNFYSPYKATSIIEFWRRWHMTLSTFLRDYIYIPLGGNRLGALRKYTNLFITMLLGGLWHGAGWTFVFWGGLHGAYLVINHLWRARKSNIALPLPGLITFIAVVVSWVFFRANSFESAIAILQGMVHVSGAFSTVGIIDLYTIKPALCTIAALLCITFLFPNTQQYMFENQSRWLRWQPSLIHAVVFSCLTITSITLLALSQQSEFLYFQF